MHASELSQANFTTFNQLERIASAFSLCGTAFVAVTFLSSEAFQKPINRLVFYACLGNIFTNVATIMARAAVEAVSDGNFNTPLCQFQAVLIQMFLPADALWTFVMALNVYLTFFRGFTGPELRRLEKYYFIACYGIPFVPALAFVFVTNAKQGHMYGNAALWCWVSSDWDVFRIATFYGPVWLVILATIAIYVYAGKEIYNKTQLLRDFNKRMPDPMIIPHDPFSGHPNEVVYVTSQTTVESSAPIDLSQLTPTGRQQPGAPTPALESKYNVTITAGSKDKADAPLENVTRFSYDEKSPSESRPLPEPPVSVLTPTTPSYRTPQSGRRPASLQATTAMLSYTKVAGLFFLAMMMTWIPSSANRVYSVINPDDVSLVLECFSAFVLPLQGFWNALIYATTSIPACKSLWKQVKEQRRLSGSGLRNLARGFPSDGESVQPHIPHHHSGGHQRIKSRYHEHETDSMTELKESRPQTGKSTRGGSGDSTDPIVHVLSQEDYSRGFSGV
ncbi:uncharacterized protein LY89DRAFT_433069 [Mollisia scopiformis]|uniref:G-protein coupled receptors family 2 profile 2 domain-containing protein n=1 Tax=Mollisia scopiformis TaxID=149040 RepID=A0A194XMD8_MOLSC|nr:uncharacterized protein LY89DRAFT_433069 [Mollisia scopiformis]KUJ21415.1 hypothetical protein LY89DRAFT_433069 [Mollisia scopiformis]